MPELEDYYKGFRKFKSNRLSMSNYLALSRYDY